MIWIKGIMNYGGKEIINDNLWHSVEERDNRLYVDGKIKKSYSDIILELLKKAKMRK